MAGGGGGQSGSLSARKKDKLGQAAFFLSATGGQAGTAHPSSGDGQAGGYDGGGVSVTSDVSAMLSGSDIASAAHHTLGASHNAAARPAASSSKQQHTPHQQHHQHQHQQQQQQQRRVSGKINYQLLKGLLDSGANTQQSNTTRTGSPTGRRVGHSGRRACDEEKEGTLRARDSSQQRWREEGQSE